MSGTAQQATPQAPMNPQTMQGLLAFLQLLQQHARAQPFQQPLGYAGPPQVVDQPMQPPIAPTTGPNIGGIRPSFRSQSI